MRLGKACFRIFCLLMVAISGTGLVLSMLNKDILDIPVYEFSSGKGALKVAQLSDLHNHSNSYSNGTLSSLLEKEKPDVVVSTGDLIDSHTKDYENLRPTLSLIKEKGIPFYFVHGNHEATADRIIVDGLENLLVEYGGVDVEKKRVSIKGHSDYTISGIVDPTFRGYPTKGNQSIPFIKKQLEDLDEGFDDSLFNIALCHQPRFNLEMYQHHYDLVFSGHTHGGQLNFFGKPILTNTPFASGVYARGNSFHQIVSNGLGTSYYFSVRFRCNAQLVLALLK